jgi:hypothetical protein
MLDLVEAWPGTFPGYPAGVQLSDGTSNSIWPEDDWQYGQQVARRGRARYDAFYVQISFV